MNREWKSWIACFSVPIALVSLSAPARAQHTMVEPLAEPVSGSAPGPSVSVPPQPGFSLPPFYRIQMPQDGNGERPPITMDAALTKAASGALGGVIGAAAVGIPLLFAGIGGYLSDASDALLISILGTGYTAGTSYGVHFAGRRQGLKANPFATTAGALLGVGLIATSGIPLMARNETYREPRLYLLIPAPVLATTGFLLTRDWRAADE